VGNLIADSATITVTSTAATCFATLGSAAVGSTTFAARGFRTRPDAAVGGGSGGEAGSRSTFAESTGSTARSTTTSAAGLTGVYLSSCLCFFD